MPWSLKGEPSKKLSKYYNLFQSKNLYEQKYWNEKSALIALGGITTNAVELQLTQDICNHILPVQYTEWRIS